MPPVKSQKSVNAGPGHDQLTHESLANVRFAEPVGKSYTATNHHPRTNAQVFHDRVMDGTSRIVEEHVDALGAAVLHSSSKVGSFFLIHCCIKANLATPLQFLVVSRNGDRATTC